MPPDKEVVATSGSDETTILRFTVAFSAEFVALTVKSDAPIAVGVPVIAPVDAFRFKPAGKLPLAIDQVIGVVLVAASL